MDETSEPPRPFHRPFDLVIESVQDMPDVQDIPRESEVTLDLKGNWAMWEALKLKVEAQRAQHPDVDFWAVRIKGANR